MKKSVYKLGVLSALLLSSISLSCIDNNNKDNQRGGPHESDYIEDAPTYNKTRDDMEKAQDTAFGGDTINPNREPQKESKNAHHHNK